jgi:predicted RNase H-like nuclease (RuvC/YqgF family)
LEATIVDYRKAITELESGNAKLLEELERTADELARIRSEMAGEIARLSAELESAQDRHRNDLDDWRNARAQVKMCYCF